MFGEGRAIGQVGLPVRANVGHSIIPFSCCSQQGRAVVDKRLPALVPEVDNVLCSVLLQVGKPEHTGGDFQTFQKTMLSFQKNSVCPTQHSHCLLVWFEQLAGELTEDGQVGEVWWRRCFRSLVELLKHKLYAVPERINKQTQTHKLQA